MYKQIKRFTWGQFDDIQLGLRADGWYRAPEVVRDINPQSIGEMSFSPDDEDNVAGVWLTAFTNGTETRCFIIVTEYANDAGNHPDPDYTLDVIYEFEREAAVGDAELPW